MAKRSIQGYVELASGLGELTRSAAKEAAAEILALAGSDASRKKAAKQVSGLADEQKAGLQHGAVAFARHTEDDPAYREALALARLVQEIAWHGAVEAKLCRQTLNNFAEYLRHRPPSADELGASL